VLPRRRSSGNLVTTCFTRGKCIVITSPCNARMLSEVARAEETRFSSGFRIAAASNFA
jgi:hypothetical protein